MFPPSHCSTEPQTASTAGASHKQWYPCDNWVPSQGSHVPVILVGSQQWGLNPAPFCNIIISSNKDNNNKMCIGIVTTLVVDAWWPTAPDSHHSRCWNRDNSISAPACIRCSMKHRTLEFVAEWDVSDACAKAIGLAAWLQVLNVPECKTSLHVTGGGYYGSLKGQLHRNFSLV